VTGPWAGGIAVSRGTRPVRARAPSWAGPR
jgi:hypothetical protein